MTDGTGPVALITGGGRGIGRACALALARAGHRVAILARSGGELAETLALLHDEADAPAAISVTADVTDPTAVRAAVEHVEGEWGAIDVLVNNAGMAARPTTLIETDVDAWWRVVEVNLRGPMLLCRAVVPGMVARGRGRVINVNSLMGVDARSAGFASSYAVSKAGLFRLTDVLAAEVAGTGVHVFDLSPGLVATQMTDDPEFADIPEEHWTPIEAVAAMTVRLASGEYDVLSGRFVHATDDPAWLTEHAEAIAASDSRTLVMRYFGSDDPLAAD